MNTLESSKGTTGRAAKRARFAGQNASSASPVVLIAGLVIAVAVIGVVVITLTRPSPVSTVALASPSSAERQGSLTGSQTVMLSAATQGHEPYTLVLAEDGAVRLPLSALGDYKAHYYTYMNEGRPIEFFALKSQDGIVRAAFNACDVCFQAKKGYTQDGDDMVCNNCGRRFPADQINVVRGGCNPSPLDRTVEGDSLVIRVADVIRGQRYF